MILEPDNNYLAWKLGDVCTPDKPDCNDNKAPLRLITFAGSNEEPLMDVRPPPIAELETRFPEKCEQYELKHGARCISGKICAEIMESGEAFVQVWPDDTDYKFYQKIPNGKCKTVWGLGTRMISYDLDVIVNVEPDNNYIGIALCGMFPCWLVEQEFERRNPGEQFPIEKVITFP